MRQSRNPGQDRQHTHDRRNDFVRPSLRAPRREDLKHAREEQHSANHVHDRCPRDSGGRDRNDPQDREDKTHQ